MLRGASIPQPLGDTNFGNLAAAYETLDDDTKEQLAGLYAEHEYKFGKTTGTEAKTRIRLGE